MEKTTYEIDGFARGAPYSHVVEAGGFLFVSGMLPIDAGRNLKITDDVKAATGLVLSNVKRALESTGSDLSKVVKATVFLRDIADFGDMNEVYRTFFPENPPARSCIAVREVPGGFPVEIEVVAIK